MVIESFRKWQGWCFLCKRFNKYGRVGVLRMRTENNKNTPKNDLK